MTSTATLASELDTTESAALTAAHAGRQRTRTVAGVILTRESFDAWAWAGWSFRFDGGDWWALPPVGRESERELFGSLRRAVAYAVRQDAKPETPAAKAARFRAEAVFATVAGNHALADVLNDQAERIEDQLLAAALDSPATTPASAPDLPRPTGDTPQPESHRPAAVALAGTVAGAPALGAGRCPSSLLAPFVSRRTR